MRKVRNTQAQFERQRLQGSLCSYYITEFRSFGLPATTGSCQAHVGLVKAEDLVKCTISFSDQPTASPVTCYFPSTRGNLILEWE